MAVKNMQTVAAYNAEMIGVSVTGTESIASKRTYGHLQVQFLSMPWRPLPGPMPTVLEPDAAAAQAERTGRSARDARGTVLSTRPSFMRNGASNPCGLLKQRINRV